VKQPGPNPYLKTKIMTASREELRLMLYDGAIKFCHQAKAALADKRLEDSYHNLMRAQKIVLELSTSLNHKVDPELCERLAALYTWIYRLLVDANLERDGSKVDEALQLLSYERETWVLLMKKLAGDAGDGSPAPDYAAIQQTAISSLSKSA
jgi:flagellar protein FliS